MFPLCRVYFLPSGILLHHPPSHPTQTSYLGTSSYHVGVGYDDGSHDSFCAASCSFWSSFLGRRMVNCFVLVCCNLPPPTKMHRFHSK